MLIEEVWAHEGKADRRECLLPAPPVLYDVMAPALWREAPLEHVPGVVCEGLQRLGGGHADAVLSSKLAISQARTHLRAEAAGRWFARWALEAMSQHGLKPRAAPESPAVPRTGVCPPRRGLLGGNSRQMHHRRLCGAEFRVASASATFALERPVQNIELTAASERPFVRSRRGIHVVNEPEMPD